MHFLNCKPHPPPYPPPPNQRQSTLEKSGGVIAYLSASTMAAPGYLPQDGDAPPRAIWEDSMHHNGEFTDQGIAFFIKDTEGVKAPRPSKHFLNLQGTLDQVSAPNLLYY